MKAKKFYLVLALLAGSFTVASCTNDSVKETENLYDHQQSIDPEEIKETDV